MKYIAPELEIFTFDSEPLSTSAGGGFNPGDGGIGNGDEM